MQARLPKAENIIDGAKKFKEKIMKKFTKYLILFAAAAIAVACVFSGCGGVYEHVHAYGEPE